MLRFDIAFHCQTLLESSCDSDAKAARKKDLSFCVSAYSQEARRELLDVCLRQ